MDCKSLSPSLAEGQTPQKLMLSGFDVSDTSLMFDFVIIVFFLVAYSVQFSAPLFSFCKFQVMCISSQLPFCVILTKVHGNYFDQLSDIMSIFIQNNFI